MNIDCDDKEYIDNIISVIKNEIKDKSNFRHKKSEVAPRITRKDDKI